MQPGIVINPVTGERGIIVLIQLLILQAQHSKIFGMILHVYCEEYFFMFEALIIDCYLWFDCWRWEWLSSICWWRVSLVTTDNSMKKYEVILRRDTEDDTEDDINSCVKDDTCDKASSRVQWRNCNVVTGSWAHPWQMPSIKILKHLNHLPSNV